MPDYFTDLTAAETLKCTPEEANVLIHALIGDEKPEEIDGGAGLRASHSDSLVSVEYDRKSADIYIRRRPCGHRPSAGGILEGGRSIARKARQGLSGIRLRQHLQQALS